ncbi:hypothetical protein ABW19_dt0210465 [Dactylella cylindrospora]|nr:hypothetical protein ABW19_dt0210465 [Dactylella cylindrospora]
MEAIRATDQAAAYYNHLVLLAHDLPTKSTAPPDRVSLPSLSPTVRKATIEEARRILDLKLFVDYSLFLSHGPGAYMHLACLIQSSSYIQLESECEHRMRPNGKIPTENRNDELVEARVYGSMYRLFTLSAVLTNIYFEPFFTNNPLATSLRKAYELYWPRRADVNPEIYINPEYYDPIRQLKEDEVSYLMEWECFNKRKMRDGVKGGLAEIFEHVAGYFCEKGKKEVLFDGGIWKPDVRESQPSNNEPERELAGPEEPTAEPSEVDIMKAAELQQLMMLNTCYEVWMRMRERMDTLIEPVRLTHEKLLYLLNRDEIDLITIPVVFHAIYGIGDAMMPARLEDFKTHPYGPVPPNLHGLDNEGKQLKHVEVPDMLYQLVSHAGDLGPGSDAGRAYFEFGWPEYGFFEWVASKRFGMKICWGWEYIDSRYNGFIREGRAFTDVMQFKKEVKGVVERR